MSVAIDSQRLVTTFLDLVQIDSPSGHEAAVAAYCQDALTAAGCVVEIDETAAITGSDTGNLIAELAGDGAGKLFFSAHMDTVSPGEGVKPVVEQGMIRASGDTILGADDKVGIAAIIEMVRVLQDSQLSHPTIGILLSVGEEKNLLGANAMDATRFSGQPCFVLDSENEPGEVVVGAPFHNSFKATFKGKAAHAGVCPENGVSAITFAAAAINAMRLGRLDEVTTANIGTITGGSADNIVADNCVVTGEFRSLHERRLNEVGEAISAAIQTAVVGTEASVDVIWEKSYPGFLLDEGHPVVQLALKAAERIGLSAQVAVTGGGSDTNVFSDKGLQAVTLGTGMKGIHGLGEYMAIADLEALTRLILQIALDFR